LVFPLVYKKLILKITKQKQRNKAVDYGNDKDNGNKNVWADLCVCPHQRTTINEQPSTIPSNKNFTNFITNDYV